MESRGDRWRLYAAVGFLSAAVIALQLTLMQILCIVQWYHFAAMVISIALLGFGAAGTLLSVLPKKILQACDRALPLLMFLCAGTMSVVVRFAQLVRFDVYVLFTDASSLWRLPVVYLLYFLPFLFAALAIGIIFTLHAERIGMLYLTNLIGSGAGSAVAIVLAWIFVPGDIPAVLAALPLCAGIVLLTKQTPARDAAAAILAAIVVHNALTVHAALVPSEYKPLVKTLALPGAVVTARSVSPYGMAEVVSSPALRFAPGVSLAYRKPLSVCKMLFNNGDWYGPLLRWRSLGAADVLVHSTQDLPFAFGPRATVLVLDAGTGSQAMHALRRGALHVTAVEPNASVVHMMTHELAAETDSIYLSPSVRCVIGSSRTFLQTDTMRYDLITLPVVGAFGGSSGLFALQEQYLLTQESFHAMWRKLTPDGVLSLSCWMDQPVRNPLKLIATAAAMLEEEIAAAPRTHVAETGTYSDAPRTHIAETGTYSDAPRIHVAAVRNWAGITITVKRTPFTAHEIGSMKKFCDTLMFDPLIMPMGETRGRIRFHTLPDSVLETAIERCFSPGRRDFTDTYDFYVAPATDDRPYYSQFLRWRNLPQMAAYFGDRALSFFEAGYLIVLATLVQAVLAAVALILLPLVRLRWKGGKKFRIAAYFAGLGAGYMCIEIVLIQRFILYFGNPLFAAAAVIGLMLVWSGIGSGCASGAARRVMGIRWILAAVIFIITFEAFSLTPILRETAGLPLNLKAFLAVCLIGPAAFLMGMPFPLGISALARTNERAIPWAWGINGCVSVVSSVCAIVIAVELGFTCVMLTASLSYSVSLLAAGCSTSC